MESRSPRIPWQTWFIWWVESFCRWWYDRPLLYARFPSLFQILALILLAFFIDWGFSWWVPTPSMICLKRDRKPSTLLWKNANVASRKIPWKRSEGWGSCCSWTRARRSKCSSANPFQWKGICDPERERAAEEPSSQRPSQKPNFRTSNTRDLPARWRMASEEPEAYAKSFRKLKNLRTTEEVQWISHLRNSQYKLPTIDLFAPDKPKINPKEKISFVRISKYFERDLASFNIKATVERAESAPVTKYDVAGYRCGSTASSRWFGPALAAKDTDFREVSGRDWSAQLRLRPFPSRELWSSPKTDPAKLLRFLLGRLMARLGPLIWLGCPTSGSGLYWIW